MVLLQSKRQTLFIFGVGISFHASQPAISQLFCTVLSSSCVLFFLAPGSCDAGWVLHGDFCYYISTQETSTWFGAETLCAAMGPDTHLVSIHSADEQSFLEGW